MIVHQLLHGYKKGHQLLSSSIRLDSQNDELITRLSDLSGSMTFDLELRPYLTCYSLPNSKYYAIGKTWLDTSASRRGCVLTHTLLIPRDSWMNSPNPSVFKHLIDKPANSDDIERYHRALEVDTENLPSHIPYLQIDHHLTREFVYRFFGEGISPIVWFSENNTEEYFWSLANAFWPQLRGQFSCCTFCLQPRFLDDRPFNLMFAPISAYSRFQQMQRESIIDTFSSLPQTTQREPWLKMWARQITEPVIMSNEFEDDIYDEMVQLGSFLNSDPTAIKKLYLVQELRNQSHNSPMAPIGLLDMVESLAPGEDEAIDYKDDCFAIALQAINYSNDIDEILKCLILLSDRLLRKAYRKLDTKIVSKYYSLIEKYIFEQADATLQAADRLFNGSTELANAPYVQGMALGLLKIGSEQPSRLRILHEYPNWTPLLIGIEPNLGLLLLKSGRHDYESTNLETVTSWISKITDVEVLRRVRRVMVQTDLWSDEVAKIIAATYAVNTVGLEELIQTKQYDQTRKAQILSALITNISQNRFMPTWFCEFAQKDTRLLPELLLLTSAIPDDVAKVVKKILDEVSNLPLAWVFQVDEIQILISSYDYFSDSLVTSSMQSAIIGYIIGSLDWQTYQKWESTSWGIKWLSKVGSRDLQIIFGDKCSESKSAWINGWTWLANVSEHLYKRNISLIPILLRVLLSIRYQEWPIEVTNLWTLILTRVYAQPKQLSAIQCSTDALSFSFRNTRYPVSKVVVKAFLPVYNTVVESEGLPSEINNDLFSYFDWDKGKELRKKIIDAFIYSSWPPGDLALSTRDLVLLGKIYSRLKRHWKGKEYIQLMLSDLSSRTNEDPMITPVLKALKSLTIQNFYESWD
jgi:hypothetical protein